LNQIIGHLHNLLLWNPYKKRHARQEPKRVPIFFLFLILNLRFRLGFAPSPYLPRQFLVRNHAFSRFLQDPFEPSYQCFNLSLHARGRRSLHDLFPTRTPYSQRDIPFSFLENPFPSYLITYLIVSHSAFRFALKLLQANYDILDFI